MIIYLRKSKLFTVPPAVRFGEAMNVDHKLWDDIWKRYRLLDYTTRELRELFELKTGKKIHRNTMNNWIFRTEVYSQAQPLIKKGAVSVRSEFFNKHEGKLILELTKHIRTGCARDSRTIV